VSIAVARAQIGGVLTGALCSSVLLGLVLLPSSTARAGGLELMPGGAHAVGRGGAVAARPTNPMTVLQNPAGLAFLSDDQLILNFDTSFHDMCVSPYGLYGWGVYLPDERSGMAVQDARRSEFGDPASTQYSARYLDKVCNSAKIAPIPNVAFAYHLTDQLSLGFGIVAPVLVSGLQYGGKNGTIAAGGGARPTPTRYEMINAELLFGLSGVAGLAYRVIPELSLGLALQVQSGSGKTNAVMARTAGTNPADDIFVSVAAHDYFVPALTFSVLAKPISRLTVTGMFTWNDGVRGSGDVTFTTNTYHQGASGTEFVPLKNDPIKLDAVNVELPWTSTIGIRYAQPLPGAREGDPLDTEIWDIEADASYTFYPNGGRDNRLDVGEEIVLEVARANGVPQEPLRVEEDDIEQFSVDSHQKNYMGVRLGGTYNVLPSKLSVSAGAFFETRGVEPSYANIDTFAFARFGFGLGLQMRFGSIDLSAAYAHIFSEALDVAPPPHQPRQDATDDPQSGFDQRIYRDGVLSDRPRTDPAAPSPKAADGVASFQQPAVFDSADLPRRVVNAGKYTASFDVVSVAFAYRF
jgi:long-subunit fatty acid transport protein